MMILVRMFPYVRRGNGPGVRKARFIGIAACLMRRKGSPHAARLECRRLDTHQNSVIRFLLGAVHPTPTGLLKRERVNDECPMR
jgi:hypothetical protein